jgi:D-glycero-D-manno-heptose 1,7-bisphosphate phosphatase
VRGSWSLLDGAGLLAFEADGAASVPDAPAAFLDRDGTLNAGAPDPVSGLLESPLGPEAVRLLPGAADAALRLAGAGFALVCVSNQPAAAKGTATVEQLKAVHGRALDLLADHGVAIRLSLLCLHHPEAIVEELRGPCGCRKPAPGMLECARERLVLDLPSSWMFGDSDADARAGRAAGCGTVLVEYPGSAHKRSGSVRADIVAADLEDGVAQLLRRDAG